MKIGFKNTIQGQTVKDNSQYVLVDNTNLKQMTVSETKLRANQETRGHRHADQEEVYYFVEGVGEMEVSPTQGPQVFNVEAGDIVAVPAGSFHKVSNKGHTWLRFITVFNGPRENYDYQEQVQQQLF